MDSPSVVLSIVVPTPIKKPANFLKAINFSGKTSLLLGSTDDIYAKNTQVEIQNKSVLGRFYGSAFADTHSKTTAHKVDE